MTPLLTGIYSLFTDTPANALHTALDGRLYHAEAPQDATFPYCVMSIVSHEHDWQFDEEMENVLVQFSIFTNESSASTIGTLWSNLCTLFDDADLTVTGYRLISMIREQSILLRDTENNIWHYAVDYECILEQT